MVILVIESEGPLKSTINLRYVLVLLVNAPGGFCGRNARKVMISFGVEYTTNDKFALPKLDNF